MQTVALASTLANVLLYSYNKYSNLERNVTLAIVVCSSVGTAWRLQCNNYGFDSREHPYIKCVRAWPLLRPTTNYCLYRRLVAGASVRSLASLINQLKLK